MVGAFAYWYYSEMPRLILRAGRGYAEQIYFGFSVPLLSRTIFAPWKRDVQSFEQATLGRRLQLWGENLLSRLIGASIRVLFLGLGLVLTGVEISGLVGIWLIWLALPLIATGLVALGVRILLGGS